MARKIDDMPKWFAACGTQAVLVPFDDERLWDHRAPEERVRDFVARMYGWPPGEVVCRPATDADAKTFAESA